MSVVSDSYARALADALQAKGKDLAEALVTLKPLEEAFREGLISRFFADPTIEATAKLSVLVKTLELQEGDLLLDFFKVVADAKRFSEVPGMIARLDELLLEKSGTLSGVATFAQDVSEEEVDALKGKLKQRLGKEIDLDVKKDETLLGGVVVGTKDLLLDLSLKAQLDHLTQI